MNQDNGTYVLRRSSGDFNRPDHPIVAGVDAFDGEGVSPIVVQDAGDMVTRVQNSTRVNSPPFGNNNQGQTRPVGQFDGALAVLEPGLGRIIGHFDHNTFFNQNGASTSINRLDNLTYAINLFSRLAGAGEQELLFGDGFE